MLKNFSGNPVVKNPPANAGDTGLIPGPGTKIPMQGVTKPVYHNYWVHALEPPQWEAHARQLESSSHSLQLEKAHTQPEDPAQPK